MIARRVSAHYQSDISGADAVIEFSQTGDARMALYMFANLPIGFSGLLVFGVPHSGRVTGNSDIGRLGRPGRA